MDKQVINADVPQTGGPFNLCVRHGDMIYVSGLPPFEEDYCAKLRAARAKGEPPPPFPDIPFERQVRIEGAVERLSSGDRRRWSRWSGGGLRAAAPRPRGHDL